MHCNRLLRNDWMSYELVASNMRFLQIFYTFITIQINFRKIFLPVAIFCLSSARSRRKRRFARAKRDRRFRCRRERRSTGLSANEETPTKDVCPEPWSLCPLKIESKNKVNDGFFLNQKKSQLSVRTESEVTSTF